VATQNPGILPRIFDLEVMRKDVELSQQPQPILLALTQLQELVDSTAALVNSEAYAGALAVYTFAKAGGKAAALQDTLDELGKRFARKSGTAAKPPANP
jgi:hypothetical protein